MLKSLRWESLYSVARTYSHLVAMSLYLKDSARVDKYSRRFWVTVRELENIASRVDMSPSAYVQLFQLFISLPEEMRATCPPDSLFWSEENNDAKLRDCEQPASLSGKREKELRQIEVDCHVS